METITDIIAEMRDGSIYDENGSIDLHEIADRIEEAVSNFNKLKMREALEKADNAWSLISRKSRFISATFGFSKGFLETEEVVEACKAIRQALDAESDCKDTLSGESDTNCNGLQDSCKRTLQGNAAKMRKALENAVNTLQQIYDYFGYRESTRREWRNVRAWAYNEAESCRDALSAPPRNCDVYTTKEALAEAMCKDRGYCPTVKEERMSAIAFMLSKEENVIKDDKGDTPKQGSEC